jgi:hypothetical protein
LRLNIGEDSDGYKPRITEQTDLEEAYGHLSIKVAKRFLAILLTAASAFSWLYSGSVVIFPGIQFLPELHFWDRREE